MDMQAIISRIESIAQSGIEEVEKVLHDALDTVEQVLGLSSGESNDVDGAAQLDASDAATGEGDAGNDAPAADVQALGDSVSTAPTV